MKQRRNDSCYCGSGKKFKRCHGDEVAKCISRQSAATAQREHLRAKIAARKLPKKLLPFMGFAAMLGATYMFTRGSGPSRFIK